MDILGKESWGFLSQLDRSFSRRVEAAGGKGWNLDRLERYGFDVPVGGVLTTGAYQNFIIENNLLEDAGAISRSISIGNIEEKEAEYKSFSCSEKKLRLDISPSIFRKN